MTFDPAQPNGTFDKAVAAGWFFRCCLLWSVKAANTMTINELELYFAEFNQSVKLQKCGNNSHFNETVFKF